MIPECLYKATGNPVFLACRTTYSGEYIVPVATRNDRIVGTASTVPTGGRLYVRGMAVIPAARGRGVGRLLLDRIEAFAAARRIFSLFLSTTPFLAEAIGLYERCGFRRTDEGPFDLLGTPLFTMEKRL